MLLLRRLSCKQFELLQRVFDWASCYSDTQGALRLARSIVSECSVAQFEALSRAFEEAYASCGDMEEALLHAREVLSGHATGGPGTGFEA